MTNNEKLQILRDHQAWRLGGDGPMTPPKDLTAAIEYAIQCVEAMQRIDAALADRENEDLWFMRRSEIRALIALMEAK